MSKDETRSALINAGRSMIFETGFNHTGIQAVLKAADVPKGSFYYYFGSKDDFGLAVIDDFVTSHREVRDSFLKDPAGSPLGNLRRYFEFYINKFESQGFRRGCLLGNLGQELSDQNDTFRQRLLEAFDAWKAGTAECLSRAQAAGEIDAHWDTPELADFCLSAYQGAMLRMKVTKSRAPLDAFVTMFFDVLLKR